MSYAATLQAERKARLERLSPSPKVVRPVASAPMPPSEYLAHDAGWETMWHYDLVSTRFRPPKEVSVKNIQRVVADHYRVDVRDILAHRRTSDIVLPRHVAMYLTKKLTHRSLPEIGRLFGRRDHTTVLFAIRKIEALFETDSELYRTISQLRRRFV
jgi:hypothetical protein